MVPVPMRLWRRIIVAFNMLQLADCSRPVRYTRALGKIGEIKGKLGKIREKGKSFSLHYMNFPQDVTRDVAHFPQD